MCWSISIARLTFTHVMPVTNRSTKCVIQVLARTLQHLASIDIERLENVMSTVNSSTASIFKHAVDQVECLLILSFALLGSASLLAISMGQVWPLCLVTTTFALGTILGAARFVHAADDFVSGDAETFSLNHLLKNINAQSRALLNS